MDQGVSQDMVDAFVRCNSHRGGFPGNWRSLVDNACLERRMQQAAELLPHQQNGTAKHKPSAVYRSQPAQNQPAPSTPKAATRKASPVSKRKASVNSSRQDGSTKKIRSQPTSKPQSAVKPQPEAAKPQSKRRDRRSSEVASKPALDAKASKLKSTPTVKAAPTKPATTPKLGNRSTRPTPSPTVADVELRRSSRGRLRKPVMRYWENQGVRTNGLGEVIGVRGVTSEVRGRLVGD